MARPRSGPRVSRFPWRCGKILALRAARAHFPSKNDPCPAARRAQFTSNSAARYVVARRFAALRRPLRGSTSRAATRHRLRYRPKLFYEPHRLWLGFPLGLVEFAPAVSSSVTCNLQPVNKELTNNQTQTTRLKQPDSKNQTQRRNRVSRHQDLHTSENAHRCRTLE